MWRHLVIIVWLAIVGITTTTSISSTINDGQNIKSRSNITILHEINSKNNNGDNRERDRDREPTTITLNTHEVLLPSLASATFHQKKKAPPQPPPPLRTTNYQEYELHPVTFDFNLGDLEDLDHETIKKGDFTNGEQQRLLDDEINATSTTSPTTTTSTTSTRTTTSTTTTTTTTTPSTHIYKILLNKTPPKKGRELLKQSREPTETQLKTLGSTINSIGNRHLLNGTAIGGSTTTNDGLYGTANYFQMITNLYDHFYWQNAEIRTSVHTGCGLEMQAYLTALHASYEWAQRVYDASGRYRGQLLFGNDKWLGQMTFCYELNRLRAGKHFEMQFYVADVIIALPRLNKSQMLLNVGECLPKSCSPHDVQSILSLDPYARMLTVLGAHNASTSVPSTSTTASASASAFTSQSPHVQVIKVRSVPSLNSHWREFKFQVFISFLLTVILVVMVASCFQYKIDRRRCSNTNAPTIAAINGKCEEANISGGGGGGESKGGYYGKPFELFQMHSLGGTSGGTVAAAGGGGGGGVNVDNVVLDIDMNGNRPPRNNGHDGSVIATVSNNHIGATTMTTTTSDYQVETGSCASVASVGTYEAKQSIGFHQQILLCFALQTNAKAILNIDKSKESLTSCLHGLRVFSVLWTMMVHTYLQMFAIGENKFERVITERSMWYQVIGNATFSVDSFFFISGLLVTLLYLKQERKHPTSPKAFLQRSYQETLMMLIYRYLRLTPAYLIVVLFYEFAVRQGIDASIFQPAKMEQGNCRAYWWRNVLYINNFFPQREMCMMWSWYMANDMQFYVMASFLLTLSRKYFRIVVLILMAFLVSSWAISGMISLQHQYTHKVALPFESFDFLYDKPWQRVGAYIIGMLAGYVLYVVKTPPSISIRSNLLLWLGSIGLLLLVVLGVWQGELSAQSTAFYVGIGHTAFGCGLVWIVLSCCWGLAPTINAILSYRVLWPLSRLTFCAYLIHPIIMFISSAHMSGTVNLNNAIILTMFLGNAVVSFGSAFIISALFEAPIIRILKICFKK